MSIHKAIATVGIRSKLALIDVPTSKPEGREVLVRVEWTASTPLDLHQNDGGLNVTHPQVLGDGLAGTVIEVGSEVRMLAVGDNVFGFSFEEPKKKAHQEYATVNETSLSKLPRGFSLQEAVTLPNNVVTVFHAVTKDLGLQLAWPVPPYPSPPHAKTSILIWGGASSVGQYALQILRHWGYQNLITTASPAHHTYLKSIGASQVFDYRDSDISEKLTQVFPEGIPFLFDCIGSKFGSLAPLAKVAQEGAKVAVLLPVILIDATEKETPEYSMEAANHAEWADGVEVRNVRTHFYAENEFFKEQLQPTIVPWLLSEGIVKPNKQKLVEGETMLDRGQKALDMLRRKEVSAERLVWKVCEE